MKQVKWMAILLGTFSMMGLAQADVVGYSTDSSKIRMSGTTGVDPNHQGQTGSPGIGVHASNTPFKPVSMAGLQTMAALTFNHNYSTGVSRIHPGILLMPKNHREKFGDFSFAKASGGLIGDPVYFGEWSQSGNVNDGTHSVYYVGKDKTTHMPTAGTATYAVKGINNYTQNGVMTGTFNANFGTNKLTGSMANRALTVGVDANIHTAQASFSGSATANGVAGTSQGHFFGNGAKNLAGVAKFNDRTLDTAFGGVKQ